MRINAVTESAGPIKKGMSVRLVGDAIEVEGRPFCIGPLTDGQWGIWRAGRDPATSAPDHTVQGDRARAELKAKAVHIVDSLRQAQ